MSHAIDWTAFRAEFPALERFVYLGTAGGAPMSRAAAAAGAAYFQEALEGGDTHWNDWLARTDAARETIARFLNARARDIGFLGNASQALDLAERLVGDGRGALAIEDDFPSLTFPWLNRGREVVFVPLGEDGRARFEDVPESATRGLSTLAIGHVHWRTGRLVDLDAAAAFAAARGLELVVDASQGFGVFDIDVARVKPALVTFSAYKWATGGYGAGGVYIRPDLLERAPLPVAGWRSAAVPYDLTTARFVPGATASIIEQGHPPFAPVFAIDAGLRLIEATGRAAVRARVLEMAGRLRERLAAQGRTVLYAGDPTATTGMVFAACADSARVVPALKARGVLLGRWGERLRLSVHAYSTDEDIERGLAAWRAVEEAAA